MDILFALMAVFGLLPFLIGLAMLPAAGSARRSAWRDIAVSALFCTLAFNLTFFWQEIGLVVPKALVPGLDPILYHNDHDWRGDVPIAELLQGGGAVATLASGLFFLWLCGRIGPDRPAWRLFAFWMAFQGLLQSLSQWTVGTLIAGNDVGRALAYLGAGPAARSALLLVASAALILTGRVLARRYPRGSGAHDRSAALGLCAILLLATTLILPFRIPREPIEVVLIPLVVHLFGLGMLTLGFATTRAAGGPSASAGWVVPTAALATLLAFFQLVLRPGIAF